ncbi:MULTISPECIES: hypothetical protein [Burkholderia cepacia complex]|uniref:hypothetical protein n=1 Tax=Burkholderia cepacia complex TaxID=87882 RepID=UPI0016258704|nr:MULTISPECIES: hypothetical protein [Burkholderia cepacia complex]MBN3533834.1 hypothetical protein [Burkholderia cenocepacia]
MDDVQAIKARINHMITVERDRCRRKMGAAAWAQHEAWVTELIVAAAKEWIAVQLKEGHL